MDEAQNRSKLCEDVLKDLFDGDEQLMYRWLETPAPVLGGKSPKALLDTPNGREALSVYIHKLKHGDYS